jgi:hypothetical protein
MSSSSYLLPHVGSITSDPLVVGSHPVRAHSGPIGTSVSNLTRTVEFSSPFCKFRISVRNLLSAYSFKCYEKSAKMS